MQGALALPALEGVHLGMPDAAYFDVVAPRFHMPEGRFWESGGRKIEAALSAYRKFRDEFTLERPWRVVQQAYVLTDDDVRSRERREIV